MKRQIGCTALGLVSILAGAAAFGQSSHDAASAPTTQFHVVCELNGVHGNDPDRVKADRETELLSRAIADTYPGLSQDLQGVAQHVYFVVNHNQPKLTKRYMGWSAEDDPEYDYQYLDTHFYPEKYYTYNKQGIAEEKIGTIKANFTEKFLRTLDLGARLGATNSAAARGIQAFWREVISHELEHAWQFHTGPVRELSQLADAAPDGLVDPQILAETKKKVAYEHQAFGVGRRHLVGHESDLAALADAIDDYAKAHPELFAEGGAYNLLAASQANPVTDRYLREDVQASNLGEEFAPTAKIMYEGQYVPAELVLNLKKFNDALEEAQKQARALGTAAAFSEDAKDGTINNIKQRWDEYMNAGKMSEAIIDSFPYLKNVAARYKVELERYKQLLSDQ